MTKRNNKKLAEIEESLKNDKVTLKTLKSLLIEEAHRNYNTRALGIRISVAQKFQEALANGATKAELGRWWGTKNFNTIQDLLALAEPIAETAQEPEVEHTGEVSLEWVGDGYKLVAGKYRLHKNNMVPEGFDTLVEFLSLPEFEGQVDKVRNFVFDQEEPVA